MKSTKKFKENIGTKDNEASGEKQKFRQDKIEITYDELEDDDEDDDDLLDSAIEATQRNEFLHSISAIFVDSVAS